MNINFPESWLYPVMPAYGTFPMPFVKTGQDYKKVARSVQKYIEMALAVGYRHLDTAFTYQNQEQVGAAIRAFGISREEVFVTSKLHQNNNFYRDAKNKIREAVHLIWGKCVSDRSAYLDAFLLHYPGVGQPIEAWRALQEARNDGSVRHIGVSNFEIYHLEKLKKGSGEYPEINQIEFHPWIYSNQKKLLDFCQKKGIVVEGYSPLAQAQRLEDPILINLGVVHRTTPARVVLKWCMQHGVKPIIGSRNGGHLHSNAENYGFTLTREQMELLDSMGNSQQIRVAEQWHWNPKKAPFGDFDKNKL